MPSIPTPPAAVFNYNTPTPTQPREQAPLPQPLANPVAKKVKAGLLEQLSLHSYAPDKAAVRTALGLAEED